MDNLSFSVHAGEIFGILGPNGAGKTTTLEMIEGLRRPDAGSVTFMGIDALRNRRAVQQRIGVQLQAQALWPELTVEETLTVFQSLFRRRVALQPLLERFALLEKRKSLVKTLSGGQRQRLSVASAMVNDPEVVFLDEPTTGMDPQARRGLWDLISEMQRDRKTVIMTTHYMEEAAALCERVAIMDHGRIIALDTPRALVRELSFDSAIECSFKGGVKPERLAELPGVREVRSQDEAGWSLFTDDLSATMSGLVRLSEQNGARIDNLHVRTATLEDVFISMTGRRLRD